MKKSIAFCGLDCEKCDAYIATKNNDQGLREKTAKAWAELYNSSILPEQINCEGCRADGIKFVYCESMCPIRRCAQDKGVTTCGDCAELETCGKVRAVLDNVPGARENLRG